LRYLGNDQGVPSEGNACPIQRILLMLSEKLLHDLLEPDSEAFRNPKNPELISMDSHPIINIIHPSIERYPMNEGLRYGILISLILVFGVLVSGCSDQSPAPVTPLSTTAMPLKYVAGDVIARSSSTSDQALFVITGYDKSTDQYTRQLIYKNSDGSWGHFVTNESEKVPRTLVESVYPVKIAHVQLSAILLVTPTVPVTVTVTSSGAAPVVSAISPSYGGSSADVSATITGSNFQSGAKAKLTRAGYPPISASLVTVSSSSEIDCTFIFSNADKGSYNIVVTNPDGQSGTLVGAFTIGDAPPIIGGVSPSTGALNQVLPMTISGQNFKPAVKVSFVKSSTEIICNSPVSSDTTTILCNLDLTTSNGASIGDWEVTVLNIDSQQKGTWNQKFHVTNST
jgi:IPT/TIG domain